MSKENKRKEDKSKGNEKENKSREKQPPEKTNKEKGKSGTSGDGQSDNGSKRDKRSNEQPNRNKRKNDGKDTSKSGKTDASMLQDPFWYAKDEVAIKDMASFPWLEVVGSRIPGTTRDTVPALLRMDYRHTLTTNADINGSILAGSGNYITRSSRAFYNYVVQGFSSSVPFEAPDLTMAVTAAASVRAKMLEGKRAYTVLSYYLMNNKYYARGICEALGFDYDDFITHKAEFRTQYNLRVSAINNTLVIPHKFFLSDRWDFIASYLFTDTVSPMYSSVIAYVNEATLEFDSTSAKYGTCLKWKSHSSQTLYTVSSFFAEIDELMDALNDDDIRSMFAAMLRVYQSTDLKTLENIVEESPEIPLFKNDIINAAIHNMTWLPAVANDRYSMIPGKFMLSGEASYDVPIYQDASGNILCCNVVSTTNSFGKAEATEIIIDLYDSMQDPGNVLDITATMQVVQEIEANNYVFARSELFTNVYIYGDYETVTGTTPILNAVAPSWNGTTYWPIIGLMHIDSFPTIPYVSGNAILGYLGEIDRYTAVDSSVLRKLHDRCGYTLLMLPENTKSVTK